MDDPEESDALNPLIERSVLIESLRDTLDQMVEGYYITKESSNTIVQAALEELQNSLKDNKHLFSKQFVFGQLIQYKYFNQLWTFNIKNPLICSSPPRGQPDGKDLYTALDADLDDSYTPRSKAPLSKKILRNLYTNKFKIHCLSGYLKIMAVEEL